MAKRDLSKSKYLTGKNAKGETVTMKLEDCQFEDRAAMIEAMNDPRYKTDEEFRDLVGHMLQRPFLSDEGKQTTQGTVVDGRSLSRAMSDPEGARKQELALVARERYQAMFTKRDENGNLLYDKSPAYREEVRQFLIDNNDAIDAQMPAGTLVDRDQPQNRKAYRVVLGQYEDEAKHIRAERDAKIEAQAAEELREAHERLDREAKGE